MFLSLCMMVALGFGALFSGGVFVGAGVIIGHIVTLQTLEHPSE